MSLQPPPIRDAVIDPEALKSSVTFGVKGIITRVWDTWLNLLRARVNATPDLSGLTGAALQYIRLAADGVTWEFATLPAAAAVVKDVCNGRLTLETAVPVSTTDQSAKTTLYFTPFKGNQIGLYSGSAWNVRTFAELSLSLAAYTASKPYDIFAYDNAGTVTLESLVWTNPTTRATALTLQDGVLVKTGATTRRYIGTIYVNASGGQTDDTAAIRSVFNYYNRVPRQLAKHDSTASWSTGTSWQSARAQASNAVTVLAGWTDAWMELEARLTCAMPMLTTDGIATAIGEDVTNAPLAEGVMTNSVVGGAAGDPTTTGHASHRVEKYVALGFHTYNWLEYSSAAMTAYGAQTGTYWKTRSGMIGSILG